jgi:hypothetical protein
MRWIDLAKNQQRMVLDRSLSQQRRFLGAKRSIDRSSAISVRKQDHFAWIAVKKKSCEHGHVYMRTCVRGADAKIVLEDREGVNPPDTASVPY